MAIGLPAARRWTRPGSRRARTERWSAARPMAACVTSDPVDPRGSAADLAGLEWRPVEAADESGAIAGDARIVPRPGIRAAAGSPRSGAICLAAATCTCCWSIRSEGKAYTIALKRALLTATAGLARRPARGPGHGQPGRTGDHRGRHGQRKDREGTGRRTAPGDVRRRERHRHLGRARHARSSCARRRVGWPTTGRRSGSVEVPDGFVGRDLAGARRRTGRRLAIVWLGEDGVPRYDVHDGTDGWRRVWSQPLPGASAAVVAWLR